MRHKKITIPFIVLDVLVAVCFVVVYGVDKFKQTIISTALSTKTHQYIAYTFYSESTVKKVADQNSYVAITEDVNLDDIVIDTTPKKTYDNAYDQALLTRDKGNNDYKYIPVKVGGYKAHLVAIYNPAKVKLIASKSFNTGSGMESISDMCARNNGKVCINGGRFKDETGWGSDVPKGILIKDGKIIWSDSTDKRNLIGFTKDNKLLLIKATAQQALAKGMRDGLEFGPFLMVNGKSIKFNSAGGGYERAARVAIAQRKDGVVLFLVTEGVHTDGPNLKEVIDLLSLYGAYNIANLDGGTSAQLVIKDKLMNDPKNIYGKPVEGGRKVVSGFGLLP